MYAQVRHHWHTRPVRVIPKGLTCAAGLQHSAPGSSQPFVYLALSIQRSQARSKYIHVCSGAPSLAHMACTRYTERPNLRCWLAALSAWLFAALRPSATFDTTLAGTQQVHPGMVRCAIPGAHAQNTLYRQAEPAPISRSTQLPALRSTSFICHFRYNARRHAASTSMYAQVRHPWRTRPVRVIPKGRTCAAGSQLFAVLCLSATFDITLAGTQQVHPCMLKCAILGAQGLYALYRKAELALLAPSSRLSALGSRLSALGSRLSAPSSQLPAPSSQLPALNFPNNNPSKTESRYLDIFAF